MKVSLQRGKWQNSYHDIGCKVRFFAEEMAEMSD
jgi:hypothetical protein